MFWKHQLYRGVQKGLKCKGTRLEKARHWVRTGGAWTPGSQGGTSRGGAGRGVLLLRLYHYRAQPRGQTRSEPSPRLSCQALRPSLARADSTAEESSLTICPLREETFLPVHEIDFTAWEPP